VGRAIWQGLILGLLAMLFAGLVAAAVGLGIYAYYAGNLPLPEELHARANRFKTMRLLDRNGALLYEVIDPTGGRRRLASYSELPEHLVDAVVATEDASFFSNPGFSLQAIVRALIANLRAGGIAQGASTITQQLVKMTFLTDEQTLERKVKEAILAAEITRRYSKEEILEIYLNEAYLGNLSYGVAAAAETYFRKDVSQLTLDESALLAGMLQSPPSYDPYTQPEDARGRRDTVLRLMLYQSSITMAEFDEAVRAPIIVAPLRIEMKAPHFVMMVRQELEARYGSEQLYSSGWDVYTTLDLPLQREAERLVAEGVADLADVGANNGALVALDPANGDVLALVGSADFWSEAIQGQVNMAARPRQPGSSIKPFVYLVALERGWSPATMVMDVTQSFPDLPGQPYIPTNYDHQQWGAMSLRTALANSRNIPAVGALNLLGPSSLTSVAQRLGISNAANWTPGLALALGAGEAPLLDMTAAYAVLANEGRAVTPRLIGRIADRQGRLVTQDPPAAPRQLVDPRLAFMLTDILDDDQARQRAFGANNALALPFPAAAKTGTTNDYRDNWTIGYAPDLAMGVWVGNADNTPMEQLSGGRGAAPIWRAAMLAALGAEARPGFARPDGLVEVDVCPISGQRRTSSCPSGRNELFLQESTPGACTTHRVVAVCSASGQLATEGCPSDLVHDVQVTDLGPEWDAWAQGQGIATPPREPCAVHGFEGRVMIQAPERSQPAVIAVRGATIVPAFASYQVAVRREDQPDWQLVTPDITAPVEEGLLFQWDASAFSPGRYLLRLTVRDQQGRERSAETAIELAIGRSAP
jgi:1A family penicillin-binding protein